MWADGGYGYSFYCQILLDQSYIWIESIKTAYTIYNTPHQLNIMQYSFSCQLWFKLKKKKESGLPGVKLFVLLFSCRSRDRQGGQGDVVYPIGYSEKPVPDTSIQETDKNLVEKVSQLINSQMIRTLAQSIEETS